MNCNVITSKTLTMVTREAVASTATAMTVTKYMIGPSLEAANKPGTVLLKQDHYQQYCLQRNVVLTAVKVLE